MRAVDELAVARVLAVLRDATGPAFDAADADASWQVEQAAVQVLPQQSSGRLQALTHVTEAGTTSQATSIEWPHGKSLSTSALQVTCSRC